MAKQAIGIGASANDGTGSTIRAAYDICNDNFNELYGYTSLGATAASVPTEAELAAVLGTSADNGAGWRTLVSNTFGGTTYYHLVLSNGSAYVIGGNFTLAL